MDTTVKVSIGQPDMNRVKRILAIYEKIAESSNQILWGLESFYKDGCPISIEDFLEILKTDKPEDLLRKRFVEMRAISIPGLSTQKLVSSDLIDMPQNKIKDILLARTELYKLLSLLEKEDYCISLSEIYTNVEGSAVFSIYDKNEDQDLSVITTKLFEARIINDLSVFTRSDQEKLVVEKLQNLCNAINDLVELDILPCDERCLKTEFFLTPTLTVDRTKYSIKRPATLSQQIFRAQRLQRFAEGNRFRTTVNFDSKLFFS